MKSKDWIMSIKMNQKGELIQEKELQDYVKDCYKSDNPFFYGPVPYILMIICTIIDIAFFKNLFALISYDEPSMIVLEVLGLAFAADVVPSFAGILAKRIRQGLSHEYVNLYLLLSVPVLALILNAVLRVCTISMLSIDGTVDTSTIALTIFSIAIPVFTSIGNFSISFLTYDAITNKLKKEEEKIAKTFEKCRKLKTIIEDYKCISVDCEEERLLEIDKKQLKNKKMEVINDAFIVFEDFRKNLMEYLSDQASTSILSQSQVDRILDQLLSEVQRLESISDKLNNVENKKETILQYVA